MRVVHSRGVAWTCYKPAELQTWVRIPARASLRRVLRTTPTVHCGSDLRPSANFGSGFKPGSSHRSASMASPHPCLLVLALSVVVGLAIAPAMSNSATAIQSREDSPRQGTLPAEPHTSSASKLNSVAADRDLRIRPVQAGPSPWTPKAAIPVEGFEGLHWGRTGPYTTRLTPPDVQVAVGPNHVVEMVNVLGRISTKQGVEVRTFPLYSFFGDPSTDFISDPKIHFDSASNRWFASITDVTTGSVLLEVSKSDNPMGLWSADTVATITGCADQPGLALVTQQNFGIRSVAIPPRAPQLGSRSTLDTADNRVQDAMWADNRLWLTLGVGCTPTGDNLVRSCVRLIEIDTANGTIAQDFDIGFSGKYVFYPALRTDAGGNLVVVFGYSSANDYPEIRAAGRSVHDPPNTIGASQIIRVGEGPETSGCPNNSVCRYGDYFGASHDPSEPGIVWVAGEYGTAAGWATFIAAMGGTVRFTVGYAVQGGGAGYLPPTLAYVADGQSVTVALTTNPAIYTVDAGTAWSVSALLGGSGANERWATNEAVSGIATRSETLAFHYSHQFSASFNYRVTGGGSGYVAPSVSYEQFTIPRANDANLTAWVDAGSAYSFPSSLGGSNATERWIADAPNRNGTGGASATVEIGYRHQALLTFGFQGPAESSMSPGTGWYDVGFSLTPTVTPAAGWAVGIWQGSGPGAYSGPQARPTIIVVGPISGIAILYPGLTIHAGG